MLNRLVVGIIVAVGVLTAIILLEIYNTPEENTIKVINTDFSIKYMITGGKVLSSKTDSEVKGLIIPIETTSDGKLKVTIPRALLDAKIGDEDDRLFVIVDGEEVLFDETKTQKERTLIIPFVFGNQEIEISGSYIA